MKLIRNISEIEKEIEGIKKNIWSYPEPKQSRWKAKLRDNFKCVFCGHRKISNRIHYITPKRLGGKIDSNNIITICKRCDPLLNKFIDCSADNRSIVDKIIENIKQTLNLWKF